MMTTKRPLLLALALTTAVYAQDPASTATVATPTPEPAKEETKEAAAPEKTTPSPEEEAKAALKKEKEQLELENAVFEAKLKKETAEMRAQVARLKAEKDLIIEQLAHAAAKRKADDEAEAAKMDTEKQRLLREAAIAKAQAESLGSQLKALQAKNSMEVNKLQGEISAIEAEKKRESYANAKAKYLSKPLLDDGTLVISDRRIPLNGVITSATANYITDRIHFYNNANREHPIFIVIDDSPGGSVMAGYRILKAMEASDAPVHVVVKSMAASMAAAITTLAEESYAYPNAVILHHQISLSMFGRMNLVQQEETLAESNRWWDRFGGPIADRMGITKEDFIKRMYEHSSSGDWTEFGEEAQKLKWVKHIVSGIDESSFLRNPDAKKSSSSSTTTRTGELQETLDEQGRPVMYLPRINPKDVYFLYNPDGYYQMR